VTDYEWWFGATPLARGRDDEDEQEGQNDDASETE